MGIKLDSARATKEVKLASAKLKSDLKTGSHAVSETENDSVEEMAKLVVNSLDDSKAEAINSIPIADKSSIGDYLVVASGRSHRHVGAIADQLLRDLKSAGVKSPKVEGLRHSDWVLIDIGIIIIHIFRPEVREFYGIEKMWGLPASDSE